jgi:hypothetical protein
MTIPQAILAGAAIIASAIFGSQLLMPYRLASGPALVWRINSITGEISGCNYSMIGEPPTGEGCR